LTVKMLVNYDVKCRKRLLMLIWNLIRSYFSDLPRYLSSLPTNLSLYFLYFATGEQVSRPRPRIRAASLQATCVDAEAGGEPFDKLCQV